MELDSHFSPQCRVLAASDVMNVSYFSCFDDKSGAWLQRRSGLEHPVASQRQMLSV